MNEVWSAIIVPYILPALGVLISGLMTWLTTTIVNWLNTKIKDKKAADLMQAITTAVNNAVKAVCQTYVDNVKGTDGWTKETQIEALNKALEMAKATLTAEALKYIENNYGSVDNYLKTLIEAILYNLKKNINA